MGGTGVRCGMLGAVYWLAVRLHTPAPLETHLRRPINDVGIATDAAISPDGKLVAYSSSRDGSVANGIWRQDPIELACQSVR
jgi:hypothetical protein